MRKSVFSIFAKRHGQLQTNTNYDELEERLLELKLPFAPTTSLEESLSSPEVASKSNSRKRKKTKKQQQTSRKRSKKPTNILQWLQDSIVTDIQTDLLLFGPLPDPESEVSLHFLVDKINEVIKVLKSRSIQNKSNKFMFAKWLQLCQSKYFVKIIKTG